MRIILIINILCFLSSFSQSQIRNLYFNNYSVDNGLSDSRVHCIFQDKTGWIWIGTDNGINRFDGYNFSVLDFGTPESELLNKSLIRTIFEDSHGNLWIGAENSGCFIYNRSKYEIKNVFNSNIYNHLSNDSVWTIAEDKQGFIWIGTSNGLNKYDTKSGKTEIFVSDEKKENYLADNYIRTLLIDQNGILWIGTGKGVNKLNPINKEFEFYKFSNSNEIKENEVWEIFEDSENQIWVGTYLGGLKKYNKSINKFDNIVLDSQNDRTLTVRSISQDKKGQLWIGTRGGLYSLNYKTSSITAIHDEQNDFSLAHNSILNVFSDKKGDLWIGTREGISYLNFDRQAFGNLTVGTGKDNQLNNGEIYALCEPDEENIWIGTESGGVNIYNKVTGKYKYIRSEKDNKYALSSNCIKSINNDGKGNLLIGTFLGGLNVYNTNTEKIEHYLDKPDDSSSISGNTVWTILKDSKGQIWIGTDKGVDQFLPESGKFINFNKKFGVKEIVKIFEDSKKRFWLASDSKLLTMISPDGIKTDYPFKVRSMCEDGNNNIWFGTIGDGLLKFNPQKNIKSILTTSNGLCNNTIYGILLIDDQFLWLSTKNGLSKYDILSNSFENYYKSDGLLNNQFNYGAYLKCKNGDLVFGGKKGVDFIFMDQLHENNYIPPVVLVDFKIFNKPVSISTNKDATLTNFISETKEIMLDYSQSVITFEFAALNYANSPNNQYKYKLEGFDKDWNNVGIQRWATYTNLEPGNYTLRILGSNNNNKFNNIGTSLKITVLPPFWKTWWFKIFILLLLLLLGYLIIYFLANREKLKNQLFFERMSARKVHELDMLKHQFFMNISHEIRTPLSLIIGPLEKLLLLDPNKDEIKAHLAIMHRNAKQLIILINQLLDYRKLETGNVKLEISKGNIVEFSKEIIESFKELAIEKKIDLQFKTIQPEIITLFDPDKMGKILNNLISNALKFTDENGSVTLSISLIFNSDIDEEKSDKIEIVDVSDKYQQYIKFVVQDTGIGIPSSQIGKIFNRFTQVHKTTEKKLTGSGIGLSLTKELVKIHQGQIYVKSKEGKGTKFSVLIPFKDTNDKDQTDQTDHKDIIGNQSNEPGKSTKEIEPFSIENIPKNIPILLIADDNKDIRSFIKYHFEPGYAVIEAINGKEAWQKALEYIPDLAILDIMMPMIEGDEVCRRIKRDERTSHIPVIILTALTSKEKQISGIDAKADDYITKPFDITLLKAKADNLLSIRKALREKYSKEFVIKPQEVILASPDEKFLSKIIHIVEKNISDPELDITKFSQQVGVSKTQLYRKISALTDMSVKEFIRDIRLKRAAQLLVQDKLNVSEIAYQVGFRDISHFRKCFREKFGMSSTDFIKSKGVI